MIIHTRLDEISDPETHRGDQEWEAGSKRELTGPPGTPRGNKIQFVEMKVNLWK